MGSGGNMHISLGTTWFVKRARVMESSAIKKLIPRGGNELLDVPTTIWELGSTVTTSTESHWNITTSSTLAHYNLVHTCNQF